MVERAHCMSPDTAFENLPTARRHVICYSFFNFGGRWGWVVNSTPRTLYPWERPGTHCTGGWVGPRAGLDGCGKSRPHQDSISGLSSL
jgi:hypothetical protein